LEARKCSAAQGPHSEVVPRAFGRLVSKSCDECKGSFVRGCEAKRWSHWTYSSLWTIFQPMRINSVPYVKGFCNNKNVLRAQSMVWHFVRHPVYISQAISCVKDDLKVSGPETAILRNSSLKHEAIAHGDFNTFIDRESNHNVHKASTALRIHIPRNITLSDLE